jgi:uncharacterized protein (DUF1800 family)
MSVLSEKVGVLAQDDAIHLLRRTTFATDWPTISKFSKLTTNEAVDLILNNGKKAKAIVGPDSFNNTFKNPWQMPESERTPFVDALYKAIWDLNGELKGLWSDRMGAETESIAEKMTLFWHGHFTTQFTTGQIMHAPLMLKQNNFFRTNCLGNFRNLLENICLDSAMVIYLNTQESTKKAPNENFSREFLELFSIGIGNYTETDIQEGAKVFTGIKTKFFTNDWDSSIPINTTFLEQYNHEFGEKTYFGVKIPTHFEKTLDGIMENEIKKMVDILIDKKKGEMALFICEKLFRYFVYSNAQKADKQVITEMAKTFINANFEIKPVLEQLLKSEYFYGKKSKSAQLKTPTQLIVGITKHFKVDNNWRTWVMATCGQELLNPPNVSGWSGYRKWSDTHTFPYAVQQMTYFIWNQKDEYLTEWIKQFRDHEDSLKLVEDITTMFLVKKPSESNILKFQKILLNGTYDYEWINILKNASNAGGRLKNLFIQLVKSPDFHLC